jgi:hypothetical protein
LYGKLNPVELPPGKKLVVVADVNAIWYAPESINILSGTVWATVPDPPVVVPLAEPTNVPLVL